MNNTEDSSAALGSIPNQTRPTDAEVSQLLQEAAKQYEECMRIADLADISEGRDVSQPRYAWDNPIGLVVPKGSSNAELV